MTGSTAAYSPPGWLRPAHVATILPALLRGAPAAWTSRERLELEDGDFLDLAWRRHGYGRLVVLSHGLEGSVEAGYITGMAGCLAGAGWDILAWNYRNCGAEPNRLARSYHSGESGDLRAVVNHAAGGYEAVALVGFSLGGNITLKCAGEPGLHPAVRAVAGISAPVDLGSSARALDQRRGNWLYRQRFLRTLLARAGDKARRFPGCLDRTRLHGVRSIVEFDDCVTAPLHGFASAADYYARASARPLLSGIPVPALLLNALNDPLLDAPSFPASEEISNARLTVEFPSWGGHLGFPAYPGLRHPWHQNRVRDFLDCAVGPVREKTLVTRAAGS